MSDGDGCLAVIMLLGVAISLTAAICVSTLNVTAVQIVAASRACAVSNSTVQRVYVNGDFQCMNGMKGDRPK